MLRKNFILLFCLLLFIEEPVIANVISKIEKERQNCIEINYYSDYTMSKCNYDAIKRYDNETQKILKKIKNYTTKSQYDSLLTSQSKWNEFIEYDNSILEELLEKKQFEDYLISSAVKCQNKKYRLEELIILYTTLKKH